MFTFPRIGDYRKPYSTKVLHEIKLNHYRIASFVDGSYGVPIQLAATRFDGE